MAVRLRRIGLPLALAAFVVGDIALATFAIRHVRGEPGIFDGGPAAHQVEPASESTRTPTATPRPRTRGDADGNRLLVDIGAERAVARAVTGTCGKGGGKVELSLDGGKKFVASTIPSASVILRVVSLDADNAQVIAADSDCAHPTVYTTDNGGGRWSKGKDASGSWHRLPRAEARVHAPARDVRVPCTGDNTVSALSTLNGHQAYVLCSDGQILRSTDGGRSWSGRGRVAQATDLDFLTLRTGLAVTPGDRSCRGVRVRASSDGGKTWYARACVRTPDGATDVSADGKRAYLGVGDALWFSDDEGHSWVRRS